jgi:antitoxin (DNA-binding transcriptional repressor) of toxin-antitoxin stability system
MAIEMAILMAMASYSVAEAKNDFSRLLDLAVKGEEVVITRRGRPIIRFSPELPQGQKVDFDWLRRHQVVPEAGSDFDSAAAIRQMRDDYRY